MNQSENINELAAALAKAQGEMQPVYKDKKVAFDTQKNDKVKYKYADLASVWDSCRQPLSAHGIAVVQTMEPKEGLWVLTTTLVHASGQWMKSMLPINVNAAPTALGSSISYMRRYALCAMVSIAPEDDDGQEASKEYEKQSVQRPQQPEQRQERNDISDKIAANEVAVIINLTEQLDEESRVSFFSWIKKTFNAADVRDIPKAAFDKCLVSINAKLKYLKDQDRVVA